MSFEGFIPFQIPITTVAIDAILVSTNFVITEPTGDATTGASKNDATIT